MRLAMPLARATWPLVPVAMIRRPTIAQPIVTETPLASLRGFRGTDDTIAEMVKAARGLEGEQSPKVRQWSEAIVRNLRPKDYLGEIIAIRHWCTGPKLRYTNDQRHVELVKTPQRVLIEIETYGVALVDCDDVTTLLVTLGMCLGRNARFTKVGFGMPGDYTHVFGGLQEPRSGAWILCDPVAGTRERQMASTATTWQHISLDE